MLQFLNIKKLKIIYKIKNSKIKNYVYHPRPGQPGRKI
ncbi:MAG: hypothetical protein UV40_C0018G0008 [Parcubacteria group bacterium GW2011_GWA1_42_7]|nr:MAG: hypothetical protein UV34_C0012G0002 [Parcubacteria group bacterium GW2011_GWB1_42_6]KKS69635.1 MAG: hypothetical protein UV40_C0018G0008 [Parcubacteria group bacterium GW2011_GWA1_42_7]